MTKSVKKELDLSFLVQPSDEILLPSRGILYDSGSIFASGKVHIRCWNAPEEKIIDKFNKGNFYSIVRRLVENVMEEKEPIDELTLGDFYYILYWIRNISYGSTYFIDRQCPYCEEDVTIKIDMSQCETKFIPDIKEPVTVTLPKSNIVLKLRLPRVKDLIESTEKKKANDVISAANKFSPDVYTYIRCTQEMRLPDEDKTVLSGFDDYSIMLHKIWPKITAIDILAIREELSKYDHGYSIPAMVMCPECEKKFEQGLALSFDFFRPRNRRPAADI